MVHHTLSDIQRASAVELQTWRALLLTAATIQSNPNPILKKILFRNTCLNIPLLYSTSFLEFLSRSQLTPLVLPYLNSDALKTFSCHPNTTSSRYCSEAAFPAEEPLRRDSELPPPASLEAPSSFSDASEEAEVGVDSTRLKIHNPFWECFCQF